MYGADARERLVNCYAHHGATVGLAVGRRIIWEIADTLAEYHGRPTAFAVLARASDDVLAPDRLMAARALIPPPAPPPPPPPPEPAPPPVAAEPVVWTLKARAKGIGKLLRMIWYICTHKGPAE